MNADARAEHSICSKVGQSPHAQPDSPKAAREGERRKRQRENRELLLPDPSDVAAVQKVVREHRHLAKNFKDEESSRNNDDHALFGRGEGIWLKDERGWANGVVSSARHYRRELSCFRG